MTFVERLNRVLSCEVEAVIKSPDLTMELLRLYSLFFAQSAQVGWCERCMRNYYNELKNNGMNQAQTHDEAKNRTLVLAQARTGLTFWRGYGHIIWELLTDKLAIELLKKGIFSESMFSVLPVGYKVPEAVEPEVNKPQGKKGKK